MNTARSRAESRKGAVCPAPNERTRWQRRHPSRSARRGDDTPSRELHAVRITKRLDVADSHAAHCGKLLHDRVPHIIGSHRWVAVQFGEEFEVAERAHRKHRRRDGVEERHVVNTRVSAREAGRAAFEKASSRHHVEAASAKEGRGPREKMCGSARGESERARERERERERWLALERGARGKPSFVSPIKARLTQRASEGARALHARR